MRTVKTAHGELHAPAFLPDATRGVVRTLDARDVAECGVAGLMVNSLHLSSNPGASVISSAGGIHRFAGWSGPVLSDSGGFQVYSLIHESPGLGNVTRRGFSYRFDRGQDKRFLTPERCARIQHRLGTDIIFCLDHCTHPTAPIEEQKESVENTVAWASRFKAETLRLADVSGDSRRPPLLFAVIQGGDDLSLRTECAGRLLEIGFDGYGYGGWPLDNSGVMVDMVGRVAELVPDDLPLHALGIGKPENLVAAYRLGYDLFDCVIPTRDARHRRLYAFREPLEQVDLGTSDFYKNIYIGDRRHLRDESPIEEGCDCLCCERYSRAFLHHLFRVGDGLAQRLATIHNLRFYVRLTDLLRQSGRTAQVGAS